MGLDTMQRYKKISRNASFSPVFFSFLRKTAPSLSQCHADVTRNPLIINKCCNVALIALVLKIYVVVYHRFVDLLRNNEKIQKNGSIYK